MIHLLKKRWPFLLRSKNSGVCLFLVIFLVILFQKIFFQGLLPIPANLLVSWFFPFSSGGFSEYSSWVTHKGLVADDAIRQQYPWKVFAANQWENGEVPLWNPYAFSGYPQAANLQTGAFYPLNALFLVLDPKIAWTILIIFQPLLSFLFMYLFLRTLKLSQEASTFGSLVFMGMTFELLWLEQMVLGQTILWLPLVLTAIQKLFEGKKKWWIIGVFALTMSILAGYAQTTVYVFIISGFFFVYKFWREFKLVGLLMFIFPILLAAIQLIPTWEIYQYSAREGLASRELFNKFLVTPRHLLTLLSSDFFGNVATENFWGDQYTDFNLFFGAIALLVTTSGLYFYFRRKKRILPLELKWFLILALLALLFAFPPLGFIPQILNIPILSSGVPARFLFIFQFSACIISAFSLQIILKAKETKFSLKPAIFVFILLISLVLGFFLLAKTSQDIAKIKNYLVSSRNLTLTTGIMGLGLIGLWFLRCKKTKLFGLALIFLLASGEYLYLANKYLPFGKSTYLFPNHVLLTFLKEKQGIDRFWGEGTATFGTNFSTYYGLYYPEGYDSLYIKRYGELVNFAKKGEISAKIPRSDVNIYQQSIYKEKLLDLLGVKYILDKNDLPKSDWEPEDWKFPPQRYKLIWQREKFKVYENLKVLPRVYFAEQVIFKKNDKEILKEIYQGEHKQRLAVVEEPLMGSLNQGSPGEIMVKEYSPRRVIISTKNNKDGFLVLSDNYFPGWKAYINGKETKIYRTNYTFRGIVIPAGTQEIKFSYEPWSFRLGAIISLASLIGLVLFYGLWTKSKI